jgi:hypothetical protein
VPPPDQAITTYSPVAAPPKPHSRSLPHTMACASTSLDSM